MPPPVEPGSCLPASRANLALYHLGRARRQLIDARPYLADTAAGRNFDGLLSALESRIDRIRLHGLGPIDATPAAPMGWIKTQQGYRSSCGSYTVEVHGGGYRVLFSTGGNELVTTIFPDAAGAMAWCEIDEVMNDRPRVNADPVAIAYGVDGGESPVFCTVEGYPVVPE